MALQLDALHDAGCDRIFEDRAAGAKTDRPGLAQALAFVREGDVLVTWKLDRLARSLPHLIETVNQLEKNGAGLRSLTEAIDTTTPGGRLIFHVFGALAQFERDLIRERTRAGLVAAVLSRPTRRTQASHHRRKTSSRSRVDRRWAHYPRGRSAGQGRQDRPLRGAQDRSKGHRTCFSIGCSRIVHASRTICALSCLHPL